MSQNLRTFLRTAIVADAGAIKVVDAPVDRRFEIQGYAAKLAERSDHAALLCRNVVDADFACIANLLGSYERIALAMGCDVGDIPRAYGELLGSPVEPVVVERGRAPVKDVVLVGDRVDLTRLPIPFHNEHDGGPYVTGGIGVTLDPQTGRQNAGIYRHHVHGPRTMNALFGTGHHGQAVHQVYKDRGERMPFAIAIGHHPAVLLAAVARLPQIGGEFAAAGGFMHEPVTLVRAEESDLLVPAEAEFVLEGYVDPGAEEHEGPFGEWPGHYLGDRTAPIFTVTTITHRRDAIFQDVLSSVREHLLLGGIPRAGSIYRAVKQVVPSVKTVNIPADARMHCYVSLTRRRQVDVKRAAFTVLSTEPENLRAVIVVDDDINVFDDGDVLWAIGTRFDARRDLTIVKDWSGPGGLLPPNWEYHADGTRTARTSSAIIIDATKPPPPVPYPVRARVPDAVLKKLDLGVLSDLALDAVPTEGELSGAV